MFALAGPFPPPVSLSSGHCTVLSGSEPKWGPFRGIFRYFHGRMERIFISHFSFSITEQTQFWTTHRHACVDTHKHTPALPSLTQTSESSTFQLPAISSIFSQQTGSHFKCLAVISHRGSSKHCNTHCKGNVPNISIRHLQLWKQRYMTKISLDFQRWHWQLFPKLFLQTSIWLTCSTNRGQSDQDRFLKGTGMVQQAPLIALSLIHLVIIGNYLSISNVLMSPWCERQSNQELLV